VGVPWGGMPVVESMRAAGERPAVSRHPEHARLILQRTHFILYVRDQEVSTRFYSHVLGIEPSLDVPGMTEFILPGNSILGLMPEAGIRNLLGAALPDPATARGIPRSEIYLVVQDPASYHRRALEAGARELSSLSARDWGHHAAYSLDPDSHVVAFARPSDDA
jgi:catechol 2,3-dioxygenase-like lactoylglutathione lyase family enzyme